MSQQQRTETQLPNNHEKQIETEKIQKCANKSTEETKQIQIIKIRPPFSKEMVNSAENLAQAYLKCAPDILKQFSTTLQQRIGRNKACCFG